MAPLILAATAALFLIQAVSAQQPSGITVFNVTPNRIFGGNETATVTGQLTFNSGTVPSGSNVVNCGSNTAALNTASNTAVSGTTTTPVAASNPTNFSVQISTARTGTTDNSVAFGAYEIYCSSGTNPQANSFTATSKTSANLAINPQTPTAYFLTAVPDKTSVITGAGTSSVVTISGQYTSGPSATGTATQTQITCSPVGPPNNNAVNNLVVRYFVNGGASATTGDIGTSTTGNTSPLNYTATLDFGNVNGGMYTVRCILTTGNGGTPAYDYGATAYTFMVMPPQVVRFGPLVPFASTLQQPGTGTSGNGWVLSGSVEFADNVTQVREIFCTSGGTTPLLLGQGATTTLSTATRKSVDFSVEVGDANSVATTFANPAPTNAASCTTTTAAGTVCTFPIGFNAALNGGTYTTPINDYGIQCYSGKIVTNAAGGDGSAVLIGPTAFAALQTNPAGVFVPTADVALTKQAGATTGENFVPTTQTTAPTVSSVNVTSGTSITLNGTAQGITQGSQRTVLCQTSFSDPSFFSATGTVVTTATTINQPYTATIPVPANATSGLYTFRCLLNTATATTPTSFVAVTDQTVNVTVAGTVVTPTSSPTAPTPTVPTRTPTGSPTAPTPTSPTRSPNPTPFPTKPRTPGPTGPVPSSCSKDDEYRAPGGCAKCISSSSPFKQVFGGSVCANPTTFSSKSTTCSTYTLQAFPRADGTSDKTAKCISQKSQVISILVVATPQSEVEFLSSSSYRKSSLRLGTLRGLSNRGLVVWVKKGNRQLIQFDDRFRTVRSQKGKTVKLTGTLRPYVGATLLRCFTAYLKVCDD